MLEYIFTSVGLIFFNIYLFRKQRYFKKFEGSWEYVMVIESSIVRLGILLLMFLPIINWIITSINVILTIFNFIEIKSHLPKSKIDKLYERFSNFIEKYI